jgi:hypothetical protein
MPFLRTSFIGWMAFFVLLTLSGLTHKYLG